MAELFPMALSRLMGRAMREWKERDAIFDLPGVANARLREGVIAHEISVRIALRQCEARRSP